MKFFYLLICMFVSSYCISQESFSETDAKEIIEIFFEGFHKGDTILMKSVMANDMVMQTAFSDKEGNNKVKSDSPSVLLKAIANRPDSQKWDERLESFTIQLDGNLAHVWTPYQFWFNDTFSHCGANAFTLAKLDAGWKIVHLIDSRRKASCKFE